MPLTPLKPRPKDEFDEAMAIVVSLAEQNVIDRRDNPREYRRQMKAVTLVRQTFGILD